ncbi:MAG TPA: hypothetical protein VHV77_07195, partial [Pirellulales bacterium]|nr:hypothetical protein [Pirellulales bacterium]
MDSKSIAKLKASDCRIAEALHDVEVPEGLAERILARLESKSPPAPTNPVEVAPRTVLPLGRSHRRRWLVGSAAAIVACAASIMGAWMLWPTSPAELGAEGVME